MMRNSKKSKTQVLIEYSDIMKGLRYAWKTKDEKMISLFSRAFQEETTGEEINGTIYRSYSYSHPIIQYLVENDLVINYNFLITRTQLKDALIRSYYEFNHEMKQKLTRYFRRFIDNEIKGINNEIIIHEILNDEKVSQYIRAYDDFDSYMEEKINNSFDCNKKKKESKTILKR